jgi:hypothetical protein
LSPFPRGTARMARPEPSEQGVPVAQIMCRIRYAW